jgi:hypothetical protein
MLAGDIDQGLLSRSYLLRQSRKRRILGHDVPHGYDITLHGSLAFAVLKQSAKKSVLERVLVERDRVRIGIMI